MMDSTRVFAATLAAGEGRRFGARDKLSAMIDGRSVLARSLAVLDGFEWLARAAIVDADRADAWNVADVVAITNPDPSRGMHGSLLLAAKAAKRAGASALLVTLGDMPFIRHDTVSAILDAADGDDALVACSGGGQPPGPPALIGAAHFGRLVPGGGDTGARAILRDRSEAVVLPLTAQEARDIDRPSDLTPARR